jgi:hypothetical protein
MPSYVQVPVGQRLSKVITGCAAWAAVRCPVRPGAAIPVRRSVCSAPDSRPGESCVTLAPMRKSGRTCALPVTHMGIAG